MILLAVSGEELYQPSINLYCLYNNRMLQTWTVILPVTVPFSYGLVLKILGSVKSFYTR